MTRRDFLQEARKLCPHAILSEETKLARHLLLFLKGDTVQTVYHEIERLAIQEMAGTPMIGVEILIKKSTIDDDPQPLRIALSYTNAIDFATNLANHAEKLQGQDI